MLFIKTRCRRGLTQCGHRKITILERKARHIEHNLLGLRLCHRWCNTLQNRSGRADAGSQPATSLSQILNRGKVGWARRSEASNNVRNVIISQSLLSQSQPLLMLTSQTLLLFRIVRSGRFGVGTLQQHGVQNRTMLSEHGVHIISATKRSHSTVDKALATTPDQHIALLNQSMQDPSLWVEFLNLLLKRIDGHPRFFIEAKPQRYSTRKSRSDNTETDHCKSQNRGRTAASGKHQFFAVRRILHAEGSTIPVLSNHARDCSDRD